VDDVLKEEEIENEEGWEGLSQGKEGESRVERREREA